MPLWVAIHGFANNENVEDEVLNRPIYELTERTNYLYSRVTNLEGSGIFESVRISGIPLTVGTAAEPVVGDFIYLDPALGTYSKAMANVSSLDAFMADPTSYALGILTAKDTTTGTMVLYGKAALATSGAGWTLTDLLESGESFRNGPYYLSAVETGKMTADPSGPTIYLGWFMEDPASPGTGDFAIMSPQYRDLAESHNHRAYALCAQPAGTQVVSGPLPTDTQSVFGFNTTTLPEGSDRIPRLVGLGDWTGAAGTQYTIWMADIAGTVRASSSPPTDFSDLYMHWESSDAAEGSGSVRLWSFETLITIGTKGLTVLLENRGTANWDDPYYMDPGESGDAPDKRTWILDVPTQTCGWLASRWREYFTDHPATDNKFSFVLFNGPHTSDDARTSDTLVVKCLKLYRLAYTANPTDTETVTVGSTVFEFDNNSTITPGNIAVSIGSTDDISFANLMDQILAQGLTDVDCALDTDNDFLMIGVPTATTVTEGLAAGTVTLMSAGAGDLLAGTAGFLVYDQEHKALVPTDAYWDSAQYWTPVDLNNGLSIMPIPYDADGTAATADTTAVADYWDSDLVDEAPNTQFRYSVGMQQALAQKYPPIPFDAASLINNGVELDSYHNFPTGATYRMGNSAVHWYSNLRGTVPWPLDWVDVNNPGSSQYQQRLLLHFVRMSVGTTGVVTSLRPADGSPISVQQCGTGEAGTTGDLELDVDLMLATEDNNLAGYQVVKRVDGQQLQRGPVVEKVIPGSGLVVTQGAGQPDGQGTVTVSLASDPGYGGEFEEVALKNAKQELIGMFPYIKLMGWNTGAASNVDTGFVAKFRVPHTIAIPSGSTGFKVIVYMTVFGETTIPYAGGSTQQYAGIDFSYSILPDFDAINITPAWNVLNDTLPDGMLTMTEPIHAEIPFGQTSDPSKDIYSAYDPMLIHNNPSEAGGTDIDRKIAQILGDPLPVEAALLNWTSPDAPVVKPGSLVGISVQRADKLSGATEYTGAVGFINVRWRLVAS